MKTKQHIFSALCTLIMCVSCTQDMDIESNQGYLLLDINTLVSTNKPNGTRLAIPEGYDAKTLHVEIKDKNGEVVKSTDNFGADQAFQGKILLTSGPYTIVAHSANWDGNASGFDVPYYYGETKAQVVPKSLVTAEVTCTQANVKITVNYDKTIVDNFKTATSTITSSHEGVSSLLFEMNKTTQSGYIPVEDFDAVLKVKNKKDQLFESDPQKFTDVKPRDHYILNYKLQEVGDLGDGNGPGVKVEVDESTNTYTYTIEVARKSAITLVTRAANAWSNFAILNASVTGKTTAFKPEGLTIQWKKKMDSEWSLIDNAALTIDATDNVQTKLTGLTPETEYEYRLQYVDGDNEVVCDPVTFKTEKQEALYNGGFEHWNQSGNPWYPNESGVSYWDTSNPGSTSLGSSYNVTTRTENQKVSGSYAAQLKSRSVMGVFAAASMYTGKFKSVNASTQAATLDWGVPFNARPTFLTGYMQYQPNDVDKVGSNLPDQAPKKGEKDQCAIYCALLDIEDPLVINNKDMKTFPNWEGDDDRVIAYGALPISQCGASGDEWIEVNIPLVYRDITKKPKYLLVVFSASKYGDYMHGAVGSTLYVDDFKLVYGDSPAVR